MVAEFLLHVPNLVELDLKENSINDFKLSQMVRRVKNKGSFSKLKILDISRNPISVTGLLNSL
jgi:hypothetical protein